MNTLADLILIGYVPLSLAIFAVLSPHRAGLVVIALGWMFLPIHEINTRGLPDLTKSMSVALAVAAGVLCFDLRRVLTLRLQWFDLATVAWLLVPACSSIVNNLGAYDAAAQVLTRCITWGVPYAFGRIYLNTPAALRDCLWVLFLSGVIYAPFALYEIRMSPQLHRIVYGSMQHQFLQTIRGGGFRPMVFMRHGLELSMWLCWTCVAGLALWRFLGVRRVLGIPVAVPCLGLLVTVLLCKSLGALALLGLTVVLMAPRASRWLRLLVLAAIPSFLVLRVLSQGTLEQEFVDIVRLWSDVRAQSIGYRFDNEALLLDNVQRSPIFGLGSHSFLQVADAWAGTARDAVPDSFWCLTLVTTGAVGLTSFLLATWLPAWRGMATQDPPRALLACSLLVCMSLLDLLFNAFVTPLLVALTGGLLVCPTKVANQPSDSHVGLHKSSRRLRPRPL